MSVGFEQAKTAVTAPKTDGWRQTPVAVLEAVRKAEAGVVALQEIAHSYGLNRKFTLDGRLVGDIGELLLCPDFKVLPDHKPDGHAHDLVGEALSGRVQIQVKLRRATKGGRIEFKYQPECLVVIECAEDWTRWRILYNGPGTVVTAEEIEVRPEDRRILREGRPHTIYLTRPHLRLAADKLTAGGLALSARVHGSSHEL